jgi:hypothetical protein
VNSPLGLFPLDFAPVAGTGLFLTVLSNAAADGKRRHGRAIPDGKVDMGIRIDWGSG